MLDESVNPSLMQRVRSQALTTLANVSAEASRCRRCRLCRDRSAVVSGQGSAAARIVFVTDAPGYHEDRSGVLLDRAPGELFDRCLAKAGLDRNEIYLTSVIKCRTPHGRSPFPDEIEACEGWLFREMALIKPQIVVTLGALSYRLITGRHDSLSKIHGQLQHMTLQSEDVLVWPLYHPAAALQVKSLEAELLKDAEALGFLMRGARAEQRPQQVSGATETPADVIREHVRKEKSRSERSCSEPVPNGPTRNEQAQAPIRGDQQLILEF